jgi:hypothetical protein
VCPRLSSLRGGLESGCARCPREVSTKEEMLGQEVRVAALEKVLAEGWHKAARGRSSQRHRHLRSNRKCYFRSWGARASWVA